MPRTYRDPIHKEIHLDVNDPVEGLLVKLIDSREVQRLRWIRQLGTSWFTFHGAEASRFQHSLGAMHVARLIFKQVCIDARPANLNIDEEISNKYKLLVMCAALLHDIGHGPFSHSCEKIIKIKHEEWTQKLITSEETEINEILREYDSELPAQIVAILNKSYPVKFLCNIVNSQLDCDRLDYLLRDSYYTGTAYGNFDLNRVISSITIDTEHDCLVVSGEKGMLAVEDYLYARYSMYLQIYQHKKCLATDTLLQKLFKRVNLLVRNKRISFMETPLFNWINNPSQLSVEDFLAVDDVSVLHHIKHWMQERDVVLKDLAKRFIRRKIFKAVKLDKAGLTTVETDQVLNDGTRLADILREKAEELRKQGLDPDYYMEIVSIASNPYSFYDPDTSDFSRAIFVQIKNNDEQYIKEISEVSHIVSSLVKNNFENTWLIAAETAQRKQLLPL